MTLKTIDAHAGGGALRLVTEGFPTPRGGTMAAKLAWARRHADDIRRTLLFEPRGHEDLLGAVLTEPVNPGAHAGVLFMDASGFRPLSGHGLVAVATIALECGLVVPGGQGDVVVFDTAAGTARVTAVVTGRAAQTVGPERTLRVEQARVLAVPAFALHAGIDVPLGARHVRADIAFGGAFYAVVDAESAGLPLDGLRLPELRRAGVAIARAVDAMVTLKHPIHPALGRAAGTIFTGPPHDVRADLRSVTVTAGGIVGRCASGTGTAAIMAVIDAMGLLDDARPFVHEGLVGQIVARVAARTEVAAMRALVPEIVLSAWLTGTHTFFASPDDPFRTGVRVQAEDDGVRLRRGTGG